MGSTRVTREERPATSLPGHCRLRHNTSKKPQNFPRPLVCPLQQKIYREIDRRSKSTESRSWSRAWFCWLLIDILSKLTNNHVVWQQQRLHALVHCHGFSWHPAHRHQPSTGAFWIQRHSELLPGQSFLQNSGHDVCGNMVPPLLLTSAVLVSLSFSPAAHHYLGVCPHPSVCVPLYSSLCLLHLHLLLLLLQRQERETESDQDHLCLLRLFSDTLLLVRRTEREECVWERKRERGKWWCATSCSTWESL